MMTHEKKKFGSLIDYFGRFKMITFNQLVVKLTSGQIRLDEVTHCPCVITPILIHLTTCRNPLASPGRCLTLILSLKPGLFCIAVTTRCLMFGKDIGARGHMNQMEIKRCGRSPRGNLMTPVRVGGAHNNSTANSGDNVAQRRLGVGPTSQTLARPRAGASPGSTPVGPH